ncbi:MAG TPA: AAA family ATPase, partial [Polyangium sp.]|nr:AAA family ATPase [Polyangium sp.]
MKVPYAKCDFAAIRAQGYFYVDKTPYIPLLENVNEDHLIFLRPRRFGKSTLISMLENYYDIALTDQFDTLFGGLLIHQLPTPKRNKYLVLTIDLSPVDTGGDIKAICKSFAVQIKAAVHSFIHRYRGIVPGLSVLVPVVESADEDMAGL